LRESSPNSRGVAPRDPEFNLRLELAGELQGIHAPLPPKRKNLNARDEGKQKTGCGPQAVVVSLNRPVCRKVN